MSLWVSLPLIVCVLNLILLFLVLRADRRSSLHRILSLFLFALAIWAFSVFALREADPNLDRALVWQRISVSVGSLGAVFYYHFTVLLTRAKGFKWHLNIAYLVAIVFLCLVPTDFVIEGNQSKFYGPAPILGNLFFLFIAAIYTFVFLGVLNLIRVSRAPSSHQERNRANYVILGTFCFLLGGLSDFLPVLGLRIYPLGMIGNALFCLFTTIAIVRHHLLDIQIVIRKSLSYGMFSALVIGLYVGIILMVTHLFGVEDLALWGNIAIIMLMAMALQPILGRAQQLVDRWFYRERYNPLKSLEQFTRQSQSIIDVEGLSSALTRTVALAMQAGNVCLMLPSPQTGDFVLYAWAKDEKREASYLSSNSPLIVWMNRNDKILTSRDLETLPQFKALTAVEKGCLQQLTGEIYMPLKTPNGLAGILVLTVKRSQQPYSNEDITLLWTFTRQAAMSIENARVYAREKERANEMERLEQMKSELLVTVSHQLKTPLTSVRVAMDLLSEQEKENPSQMRSRLVQMLSMGVDAMQKQINEILDFAKIQTATLKLEPELLDMVPLIEEVTELVTPAARAKQQTLNLELPGRLPPVPVDQERLKQIMISLLDNAIKFTHSEGCITVRAQADGDAGVVVEVEDSGHGIPEHEHEKVFQPHYQVEDSSGSSKGSGLGLAIARSLVELHGGRIWLESRIGEGSTFSFSIPYHPEGSA